MNTTLNAIRKHSPCEESWKKLLASLNKTQADDEALPLRHILDTLGVSDAIWALRSLEGADREIRLFASDCAERVLPIYEAQYPEDMRPGQAIEVARRYAHGEATEQELNAARDAMGAAARAARYAARTAARAAEREAQRELFIQYFCDKTL